MKHPDILVFISDQHSHLFHTSFGGIVDAPNFDSLAEGGALFTQAYTSCPLCVPARMSMLSGLPASETGILTNNDTLPSTTPTFLHSLVAEGYETVLVGRMHFVGKDQRHGFTKRVFGDITPVTWNRPVQKMQEERGVFMYTFSEPNCTEASGGGSSPVLNYDRAVVDAALSYLKAPHEKPQCIVVGTYGPHFPYVAPAELYQKYRAKVRLPLFFEDDPFYFGELMKKRQKQENQDTALQCLAAYCGMIEQTDRYIGALRDAFTTFARERGNERVFVYLSDHGDQVGERKLYGKQTFFEKSAKIPLVMEGDGVPVGARIDTPVSIMDLGPTLCDFASTSPPPKQVGLDLRPLFTDPQRGTLRTVVSEVLYKVDGDYLLGRMVRLANFKFITYRGHESFDLLFDLSMDPNETRNVIGEHRDVAERCRQLIAEMKSPPEVEGEQVVREKEVDLLRQWESAVGDAGEERWCGNPPTARDYPIVH